MDPQVLRWLIDNYFTRFDQWTSTQYIQGILLGLGGLIGVAMVSRIAKNFQDYFVNVMTQNIGTKIYQNTIGHTFSLPYAVFEDQQSGELLQKLIKAKDSIQTYIINLINVAFFSIIGLIFVLIYSFSVDRRVGITYCLLLPIVTFTTLAMSKRIKKAQDIISKESNTIAWSITETIRNVSLVKMLGLVQQEIKRIDGANNQVLGLELKKVKTVRTIEFVQGTLINAMRVALIGLLWYLVYTKAITIGELMSLYFYSFFLFGQLGQFGTVVKSYQEAKANHDILQDIMNQKPESPTDHLPKIDQVKEIRFEHVSFAYQQEKNLIQDFSFEVHSGQTIAFVGPSGAGKSTILKLLAWLYPPAQGAITINGQSMSALDTTSIKHQIGIVSQDAQLFSGTIRDNLLFVKPQATDEELLKSLKQASLEQFILATPEQLHTKIWEGGIKLSGGQKQRLAIARALLRNPQVLIFDEATSSLDSLVEKEIADTIHEITLQNKHLITILVAHRLSTVMKADQIYVIEQGKLSEQGTHTQLVEAKGLYYALWREQSWTSSL